MWHHLSYRHTQCYLPPDTNEVNTPHLNPMQPGKQVLDLPTLEGRKDELT